MILNTGPSIIASIALVGALTACGGSSDDSAASDEAAIVATTDIWADVTSELACGLEVDSIIPAGADLHAYEPSLRDRELLEGAELAVANGAGLESGLVDLLETVDDTTNVVEVADHVDIIVADHDHDHEDEDHEDEGHEDEDGDHDHDDEDDHGHDLEGDPHIWLDPLRVAGALPVISSALAATGIDGDLEGCLDEYRAELERVDAEITQILDTIPAEQRVLVSNHDSLAYFADRYGFDVVGTVIPSTSTLAEADAAGLAELESIIDEHHVPAIFVEHTESDVDARALADRVGVEVVALSFSSLTETGAESTYAGMMVEQAHVIEEALTAQ